MTALAPTHWVDRRTFLADLGRGALAIAVLGVAGCAPAGGSPSGSSRSSRSSGAPGSTAGASGSPGPAAPPGSPPGSAAAGAVSWQRVNLGFVSAYVLVRGGEAAIVDTGVAGSADALEGGLAAVDLGWDAVAHVILTHRHADHAGSADEVLTRAAGATGYAGAADIPAIAAPRVLTAVADGERVFGLTIVATPGHTAGHICVLDPVGGILVAGDALNTRGGTLGGSPPQFTDDQEAARASVVKLAGLQFETLLVGHGEPIVGGAARQVAEFAGRG